MPKKKINVIPCDSNWPKIFEAHADEIKAALGENVIAVHHIGSTSIPGLCAKPAIDIICEVKDLKMAIRPIKSIGYEYRGTFNLLMRLFFSRKTPNDINLHVLKENDDEIQRNLLFRNYLRENKEARDLYANTKLKLLAENPGGFNLLPIGFTDYTTQKDEIIRRIVKMTGFSGYRFTIVTTDYESQTFKSLLNLDEIDYENSNVFNLCLYKGVEIIAVALVEVSETFSKARIRKINALNDESKKMMMRKIEKWLEFKVALL
ncbi:MAG: GrpB family protein [Oscillospiraceae bacterium]|nr:GrpB family protein [Oscillospiraceae bacterium]